MAEIEEMTAEAVVWSRAKPSDKVAIVQSLLGRRMVAAMTGDGVNDAPALKLADIGVAMGISGTTVTKNSAAMVLMDDNFSTIVEAIAEGRRIYGNVQKYVTYLLSLKASECVALILAISMRVPPPMEGMLTLINLVVSHIIAPISLAWEDKEEYTMRVPPRNTENDLIVNRLHIIHRWLPWTIFHAVLIIGVNILAIEMQTGYSSVDALWGSSQLGAVTTGQSACAIAGTLVDGKFQADANPYMCRCYKRSGLLRYGSNTVIEQWGRENAASLPFDRWTGSTGNSFSFDGSVFADGVDAVLGTCTDDAGVERLCWKDPDAPRPLLGASNNCVATGFRIGHTIAYASIQLGEILPLMTFRTDGPFWQARFSKAYAVVLTINLSALAVLLYVPAVSDFLKLAPLTFNNFVLSLIVPVVTIILCEISKVNYRYHLGVQIESQTPGEKKLHP